MPGPAQCPSCNTGAPACTLNPVPSRWRQASRVHLMSSHWRISQKSCRASRAKWKDQREWEQIKGARSQSRDIWTLLARRVESSSLRLQHGSSNIDYGPTWRVPTPEACTSLQGAVSHCFLPPPPTACQNWEEQKLSENNLWRIPCLLTFSIHGDQRTLNQLMGTGLGNEASALSMLDKDHTYFPILHNYFKDPLI